MLDHRDYQRLVDISCMECDLDYTLDLIAAAQGKGWGWVGFSGGWDGFSGGWDGFSGVGMDSVGLGLGFNGVGIVFRSVGIVFTRVGIGFNGVALGSVGLTQGRFSPKLFNIYTNDQQVHDGTRSFIYADDLCITAQFPTFSQGESTIEEALGELIEYYRNNSLCANPDKTQVIASTTLSQQVSTNPFHPHAPLQ